MRSDRVYGYGSRRGGIGARDDGCAVGVGLRAGPESRFSQGFPDWRPVASRSRVPSHFGWRLAARRLHARRQDAARSFVPLRRYLSLSAVVAAGRGRGRWLRCDHLGRGLGNWCRSAFDGQRFRPAELLHPARDHLLGFGRPAKFGGPCRDYLLCCLAVLPS